MDDAGEPGQWWDLPPGEALNVAIIWAEDLQDAAQRAKIIANRCEAAERKLIQCAAEHWRHTSGEADPYDEADWSREQIAVVEQLRAERDTLAAELNRLRS